MPRENPSESTGRRTNRLATEQEVAAGKERVLAAVALGEPAIATGARHTIALEILGVAIEEDEIHISVRVSGMVYRPEARAKARTKMRTVVVKVPATVERHGSS